MKKQASLLPPSLKFTTAYCDKVISKYTPKVTEKQAEFTPVVDATVPYGYLTDPTDFTKSASPVEMKKFDELVFAEKKARYIAKEQEKHAQDTAAATNLNVLLRQTKQRLANLFRN